MDFTPLFTNPMALGVLLPIVLKSVSKSLEKVDNQKLLVPYNKHLHVIFLISTFVASVCDLGIKGQLHTLDMSTISNFLQVYIPMLVSGKAMSVTLVDQSKK